jgi:hypothetical protein
VLNIRVVQVKHRQGSRNVYNMYLTTTTAPQWQHTDGSTRQATGTNQHCLGTCPNAAQVSLYPPQRRTRVAGWTTIPLPPEPPALQSLLQWPKFVIVTRGEIGAVRVVIQNIPAKTAQGVPCCVDSMWACVIVEHKDTPGQFSSYPGSTTGIVAACVYVSLKQPLYIRTYHLLWL